MDCMEKKYTFQDFQKIVEQLRSKDGCPWDREQTHQSLKKYLVEETEEVLEGIDIYDSTGDWDNLCEELGDLLFQVMIHSVIAEEKGIFTIDDVIQGISEKMIRRHPRVFGSKMGANSQDTLLTWDEIKAREKQEKNNRRQ